MFSQSDYVSSDVFHVADSPTLALQIAWATDQIYFGVLFAKIDTLKIGVGDLMNTVFPGGYLPRFIEPSYP